MMSSQNQETELTMIKETEAQGQIPGQVLGPVVNDNEPALISVEQGTHGNKSLEGAENQGFESETPLTEYTPPLLTYMDFTPKFIGEAPAPEMPTNYSRFSGLVDQANQWLMENQTFNVWKCETVVFKLQTEDKFDKDGVLYAESSFGINRYVMGLRLWLVPRMSDTIPVAQIGYTTAIPGEPYTEDSDSFAPPIRNFLETIGQGIHAMAGNTNTENSVQVKNSSETKSPKITEAEKIEAENPEKTEAESTETTETGSAEKPDDGETGNKEDDTNISNKENNQPPNLPKGDERKATEASPKISVPAYKVSASIHSTMTATIQKLNKQLTRKPLPGVILNVENLALKASSEYNKPQIVLDPESTSWVEVGSRSTYTIFAIRILYLKGKEEFCTIGYHDELPDMKRAGPTIKFGPFKNVVDRMGNWLKQQRNIRVVNMQSVDIQCNLDSRNLYQVKTDVSGYTESAHMSTKYAKVLRLFYVATRNPNSDVSPYSSVTLSTKLFVPVRRAERSFESFPKTMERIIKWLDYTRIPPFCVETLHYQIYISGYGPPVHPDRVDSSVNRNSGRQQLTTVRLYMPSEFIEPPPEISPDVAVAESGWGCSIS